MPCFKIGLSVVAFFAVLVTGVFLLRYIGTEYNFIVSVFEGFIFTSILGRIWKRKAARTS